jgi:hypothetical protein
VNEALLGGMAVASFAIGLFFLRYWSSTRDRFFLYFAAAFWLEAVNRGAMALMRNWNDDSNPLFFIRLLAYLLIMFAIWEKNRGR